MPRKRKANQPLKAKNYRHSESESPARPDVGTQAQFKKRKPPKTYRYDSSLAPELNWDGQNPARELGEWLLSKIEETSRRPDHKLDKKAEFKDGRGNVIATVQTLQDSVDHLKALGKPFLNWAGKAERLSFDVPTLPLFVHERMSTKAIIDTLKSHRKDKGIEQADMFDLFGDPQRPIADQVLKAYEYKDKWVNRMILGDSLVVMNSLLEYENLGGQVQMIYMDPPYGVKFGSNFQPFIRKREVQHGDDNDLTREPEMVQAYRDTWEIGLHSYLSFLRDRFHLCRQLLSNTGSIFVQINEQNLPFVRQILNEIFGEDNLVVQIVLKKTPSLQGKLMESIVDYILWYAKDKSKVKYRPLFEKWESRSLVNTKFRNVKLPDGTERKMSKEEIADTTLLPKGARFFRDDVALTSEGEGGGGQTPFNFDGISYYPGQGRHWRTGNDVTALEHLASLSRISAGKERVFFRLYYDDFPYSTRLNIWDDITGAQHKFYVVQTNETAIERCVLMTTDPGDLILDPTCGGGTTAVVAENWGRRWITADVSRVPLALARQRLLTNIFPYYELNDSSKGPSSGFVYSRRQNKRGEEIGGIVPHITLSNLAYDEPPDEEVMVDRPDIQSKIVRVTGPFCFEATIPTPMDWDSQEQEEKAGLTTDESIAYEDRMIEVLRKAPVLQVGGGKTVTLKNVRRPAKTLSLSAEAGVEATAPGQKPSLTEAIDEADDKYKGKLALTLKPIAIVFGPENGAVSERLVYEAGKEASAKNYTHLYVIGFAIQPNARSLIEGADKVFDLPATYIQATPDLMMGDLLKNMRSSQIFSVCGLPDVEIKKAKDKYQVVLKGLDVFDPSTMETISMKGDDVPAWFLDTDYNGLCFHVSQAFFPRTSAWESLKKALKGLYSDSVWEHLRGAKSVPFEAGEHGQIAVKVIDDRGNELLVVKSLSEAKQ